MKVISIDIGIKNFAYCLLETGPDQTFTILQWEVVNLCGEPPECCYMIEKKKKKIVTTTKCDKTASLTKPGQHYCKTHAKKTGFVLPSRENTIKSNIKLDALVHIATTYGIPYPQPIRKKEIKHAVEEYLDENMLQSIAKISANNLSLVDIGIAISKRLTEKLNIDEIDEIIIENQLSPLANRMKTIQGMVAQFFIMNEKFNIRFISASNKLKPFTKEKMNYSQRKSFSIKITADVLHTSSIHDQWHSVFNTHKKRDDLADCLLQALWFLYDKKLFTYQINNTIYAS